MSEYSLNCSWINVYSINDDLVATARYLEGILTKYDNIIFKFAL